MACKSRFPTRLGTYCGPNDEELYQASGLSVSISGRSPVIDPETEPRFVLTNHYYREGRWIADRVYSVDMSIFGAARGVTSAVGAIDEPIDIAAIKDAALTVCWPEIAFDSNGWQEDPIQDRAHRFRFGWKLPVRGAGDAGQLDSAP